jgi:hypothetical protein
MTSRQRRALASLLVSAPAFAVHTTVDVWMFTWLAFVVVGMYYLVKD